MLRKKVQRKNLHPPFPEIFLIIFKGFQRSCYTLFFFFYQTFLVTHCDKIEFSVILMKKQSKIQVYLSLIFFSDVNFLLI